ncbi:hypothetical protein KL86DYS2_10454 [uncultured Dysgonomonas sp.]|uniref:Uncharacterized protein n=1 Tax=uncultured Dysgonomonas sp. TaxID=206096 RepID=A0A212J0F0_9BACT|nr:hypothetical protein KL86DYS2_10454 [uncultured Dysgonomonas sp.]
MAGMQISLWLSISHYVIMITDDIYLIAMSWKQFRNIRKRINKKEVVKCLKNIANDTCLSRM